MGGLRQDWKEAARFYRVAADQGNASARFHLGFCYEVGKGIEKDLKEAVISKALVRCSV